MVADLSGMSKAEVERIWLPFSLQTCLACAELPHPRRWLTAQAALMGAILSPNARNVGVTTGLVGAGGFGKLPTSCAESSWSIAHRPGRPPRVVAGAQGGC